jgi:shikimate kinase
LFLLSLAILIGMPLFTFILGMGSYVFLDTDEIIEKAVGKTINDIFQQDGEDEFRNVESQVLSSVYAYVRCVISTGGGIVCRRDNWSKLQTGIVVWLDVTPNVIIQRLRQQQNNNGIQSRPLLQTSNPLETIQNLLNERIELYQNADVHIVVDDMNETTEMISNRVIRDIHDFIDTHPPAWKVAQEQQQQHAPSQ